MKKNEAKSSNTSRVTIRILIADDHAVVREGLRTLISSQENMLVVGESADGVEVVEQALRLRPDIILMDLVMPRLDGIAAIQQIRQEMPEVNILVITSFADDDKVFSAIKAGATGYLLKDSTPQQLLQAIRDVCEGKSSLHPAIALKLIHEINLPSQHPLTGHPLSERELDVLKLVAQGLSDKDIAGRLVISEWTVRTHMRNILGKLHLANRTQAALYALSEGLAKLKPPKTNT